MTNDQLHRDLMELFPGDELAIDPKGVLGRQLFDHIVQEQSLTGLTVFDEFGEGPVVVFPEQLPVPESWNRRLLAGVAVSLVAVAGIWALVLLGPDRAGTDLDVVATAPTVSSVPDTGQGPSSEPAAEPWDSVVFLRSDASDAEVEQVLEIVRDSDSVLQHQIRTQRDVFAEFQEVFRDEPELLATIAEETMPIAIDLETTGETSAVYEIIEALPFVRSLVSWTDSILQRSDPIESALRGVTTTTVESLSDSTANRPGSRVDFPYQDFEGRTQYFADLPEGPMVIHFFASWAPANLQQFDIYETVHQEMAGEVTILGLATSDRAIEALALVEESGVTYQVGLDRDGEILSAFFEVEALPATVVINGSDMESHVGVLDLDELTELIRDIS